MTTREQIRDILIYEFPSNDWDGAANGKIDLWTETSAPCNQLSSTRRDQIEIEYRVMDDVSSYCGGENISCAVKAGLTYSVTQHNDYWWYNLHIRTSSYTLSNHNRHFVINHETGHAFGLADGNCSSTSIMHYITSGSCSLLAWPTVGDFNSVTTRANYTGP